MNDTQVIVREIRFRDVCPWLYLLRAFRLAISPSCLLLAALGLVSVSILDSAIDRLPFAAADDHQVTSSARPWRDPTFEGVLRSIPASALVDFVGVGGGTVENRITAPYRDFLAHALPLFDRGLTWEGLANHTTRLLARILVWAYLASAIARFAALKFVHGSASMFACLRFSGARWSQTVLALLLPSGGIALFAACCAVIGALGNVPTVGPLVASLLWGMGFLFGLIMSLILVGVVLGWPLMWITVCLEGSDGFDGFSRTYGYIYNRPWNFFWNAAVTAVHGGIGGIIFATFCALAVTLGCWGIGLGMGHDDVANLLNGSATGRPAGGIVNAWMTAAVLTLTSYFWSYFWCAFSLNYLLLRRCDDGTPFREIYEPEPVEQLDAEIPLAGVANSDQPVIERPGPTMDSRNPSDGSET